MKLPSLEMFFSTLHQPNQCTECVKLVHFYERTSALAEKSILTYLTVYPKINAQVS